MFSKIKFNIVYNNDRYTVLLKINNIADGRINVYGNFYKTNEFNGFITPYNISLYNYSNIRNNIGTLNEIGHDVPLATTVVPNKKVNNDVTLTTTVVPNKKVNKNDKNNDVPNDVENVLDMNEIEENEHITQEQEHIHHYG